MNELSEILTKATHSIGPEYFQLNLYGGDAIYRERVYNYELYHQLRTIWPRDCEFMLNGEVDKIAHPIFEQLDLKPSKPDLLVHKAGHMNRNYAVIEIKTPNLVKDTVHKDLETLSVFRRKLGYRRAIYLIYGYLDQADVVGLVESTAGNANHASIELWLHADVGTGAYLAARIG